MKEQMLPYYNVRLKDKIDTIVIHAGAQTEAKDLINLLEDRELSCHYVIDRNGEVFKLVDENNRAWHAGVGIWNGQGDINSNSIGIELCNELFGERQYSQKQMLALKKLCISLMKKYKIEPINVIGHSDLAPTRKIDPGTMFPWKEFAKSGIGLWYEEKKLKNVDNIDTKALLENIGYGVENLEATEWAFLRHYNPELYLYLGGKMGANASSVKGLVLCDNEEFRKTLLAVSNRVDEYRKNRSNPYKIGYDFNF